MSFKERLKDKGYPPEFIREGEEIIDDYMNKMREIHKQFEDYRPALGGLGGGCTEQRKAEVRLHAEFKQKVLELTQKYGIEN